MIEESGEEMRARNLKPGFFKNYGLSKIVPPWGRILFEGLWCMSDREGRLKDRPEEIQAEIFPFDSEILPCSIDEILNELAKGDENFIFRYEIDGKKYIQVCNFLNHQNPHYSEKPSIIPVVKLKKKSKINPRIIQDKSKSNRADSLTPYSLIPDSLTSDSLFSLFNENCPNLSKIEELTETRKQKIKPRLKEHPSKEWWISVFQKANLITIADKDTERIWKPDFDWLIKNDNNAVKVYEGKYDQQKKIIEIQETKPPDWVKEAEKEGWK